LNSVTSELEARIAREGSTSAEIRLRELQRRQEYLKEVETQATETRREAANLAEKLKEAESDLERMTVRAPISGQVVAMVAQAPGGVVAPNSKLMEIVPTAEKLLIDVQVPITAANRVKVGLETDIRISSFPDSPILIIAGRVQSVSSDRHEPPPPTPPYYLARVEVTPEGIAQLQGKRLNPGMSTEVVIKTGERSFMRYLLDPITRRLFESLKEP
jgi:protease secretion system membrane fusion protein